MSKALLTSLVIAAGLMLADMKVTSALPMPDQAPFASGVQLAQYRDQYGRTGWRDGRGVFHPEPFRRDVRRHDWRDGDHRRGDWRGSHRHHGHWRGGDRHDGWRHGHGWGDHRGGHLGRVVDRRGPIVRFDQHGRRSDLCVNRRTGDRWRC